MPWAAKILELTPTSRGFEVAVVITDGVSQKFVERFQTDATLVSLRNQVRQRTVVVDEIHTKPEFRVGDVLDLTPDPVPGPTLPADPIPPTDAEVARANFFTQYATWQSLQRGLAAGLVDTATVAAQLAVVQKAFDPSYVSAL
jgi:hypothetical protein